MDSLIEQLRDILTLSSQGEEGESWKLSQEAFEATEKLKRGEITVEEEKEAHRKASQAHMKLLVETFKGEKEEEVVEEEGKGEDEKITDIGINLLHDLISFLSSAIPSPAAPESVSSIAEEDGEANPESLPEETLE
jgi:hypothetical protein